MVAASMWGTPQRSRRTRTAPSSPSSSIVPSCCGSGRRASRCQATAAADAARPVVVAAPIRPARTARLRLLALTPLCIS